MHKIVRLADGHVLDTAWSCEGAFDLFCFWLQEYKWDDIAIEGDCPDE